MASLSDILTAAKNVVTSVNQLGLTYLKVQGAVRSTTMTTTTLVTSGQGRLASVSVVVAGSSACVIYDGTDTASTANALAAITNVIGVTLIVPVSAEVETQPVFTFAEPFKTTM